MKTILLDIAISLSPRQANTPSPSKMVSPHSWELNILSLVEPHNRAKRDAAYFLAAATDLRPREESNIRFGDDRVERERSEAQGS